MAVADPEMVQEYARHRPHGRHPHLVARQPAGHVTGAGAGGDRARASAAVQGAMGRPIAPFFRFPYLRDSQGDERLSGQARQIAAFSIDVGQQGLSHHAIPSAVQRKVMADLARHAQGHHPVPRHPAHSTARALPGLLAELKVKGYKVVHIVPKGEATTIAEFDGQAQQELGRRRAALGGEPLARRSLTWPAAKTIPAQPAAAELPATPPCTAERRSRPALLAHDAGAVVAPGADRAFNAWRRLGVSLLFSHCARLGSLAPRPPLRLPRLPNLD